MVKGILSPEDAKLAAQHRVAAIQVSNHGGRQLDGVQATVRIIYTYFAKLFIYFAKVVADGLFAFFE